MPGGEIEGGSGGSSGASSSSGRTSVALDVGCLKPFNPKGEPHSLSQRLKRWKRAFNLYVTGKGVSVFTCRGNGRSGNLLHTCCLC